VLILPYRNPVLTAKMLSTLDVLSGGRLILGAGVGWMEEEFQALGLDTYAQRGAVTDEYIQLFKELWTKDDPVFQGEHYQLSGTGFMPKPVGVDARKVSRGPLSVTVTEEGKTRVIDRYVVSAPVAGYARRVELEVGDSVFSGQEIVHLEPMRSGTLDPRSHAEAEAAINAAEAALSAATESVEASRAEADLADLADLGWTPAGTGLALGTVAAGAGGLVLGSDLLVEGAVTIARAAGISESVIGLTLIAFGTSLPELATAVIASRHGHTALALGNALGSNIFNILLVLGVLVLIAPVQLAAEVLRFDIWVMAGVVVALILVMLSGRRISRLEGGLFLALYAAYIGIQFTP